jgi:SulP family sulfate permease
VRRFIWVIEAIFNLVNKYEAENKNMSKKHLSSDCKTLMCKANPKFKDVIVEDIDDPRWYHLAADPENSPQISEYNI